MIRQPGLRAPLNRGHYRAGLDLVLRRRKATGLPRPVSQDFVDQLTILDGIISAAGWITGAGPFLVDDDNPLPAWACVALHRRTGGTPASGGEHGRV